MRKLFPLILLGGALLHGRVEGTLVTLTGVNNGNKQPISHGRTVGLGDRLQGRRPLP